MLTRTLPGAFGDLSVQLGADNGAAVTDCVAVAAKNNPGLVGRRPHVNFVVQQPDKLQGKVGFSLPSSSSSVTCVAEHHDHLNCEAQVQMVNSLGRM